MFFRHSLLYLLAKGLPGIINLLAIALFTRLLIPEEYGNYILTIAIVEIVSALIFQWLRLGVLRFLPGCEEEFYHRLISTIFISFILISLFMTIFIFFVWIMKYDILNLRKFLFLGLGLLIVQSFFQLTQEILRAKLKPLLYGFLEFIRAFLALSFGLLLICFGWGTFGLIIGLIVAMIVPVIWMIIADWRSVSFNNFDKNIFKKLLQYGLPLTAGFALNILILNNDRILIGLWLSSHDTGIYASGFNLVKQTLVMIMMILNLASYPLAVQLLEKNKYLEMNQHLVNYFIALIGISIPITIGIAILAPDFAEIFLGKEYRDASIVIIPWIAFAILFMGIRSYYTDLAFQFGKKTSGQAGILLVTVVINFVLNIFLIQFHGTIGAAYSIFISYLVGLILSIVFGNLTFKMPFPITELIKIILSAFLMSLSLLLLLSLSGIIGLIIKVFAALCIYLICIYIFNVGRIQYKLREFLIK